MTVLAFAGSLTRPAPNYANATGQGITSFVFDPRTGTLTQSAVFAGIDDTTWLVVQPETATLFALCEVSGADQSWVVAFGYDADGVLTEKSRHPTGGQTACHASLSPDGRFLVVANYNAEVPEGAPDAAVCVFPIGRDGSLKAASDLAFHAGAGPNMARQSRSHAHCAMVSPDGRFAYVADLGVDRIVAYGLDAAGHLEPRPSRDLTFAPGTGPRHMALSGNGRRMFVISELEPAVFSVEVAADTGALALLERLVIAETGTRSQPSGLIFDAATSCLYAGLRLSDEILQVHVDDTTGQLVPGARWPCGGATPRDLAFSPDHALVVVANQDGDRLSAFHIGQPPPRDPIHTDVNTPMAIAFAAIRP